MDNAHTHKKENYEDYSSGRVLYGVSGATNFSVRIINEIFEWSVNYLGKADGYVVYDSFCGTAYSLTVLGFLHAEKIREIIGSDINEKVLEFAGKNLSLLSKEGIDKRIEGLRGFIAEYNKDSHKEALESALRLKEKSTENIKVSIFVHNILSTAELPSSVNDIDFLFADVPYGALVEWKGVEDVHNPIQTFLSNVSNRLSQKSVVAIALNKKQAIEHVGYRKVKSFSRGTRKIIILEKI